MTVVETVQEPCGCVVVIVSDLTKTGREMVHKETKVYCGSKHKMPVELKTLSNGLVE